MRPSTTGATSTLTSSISPARSIPPLIRPPPSSISVRTPNRAAIFSRASGRSTSRAPASRYETPRSRRKARYSSDTRSDRTATTWSPSMSLVSHARRPLESTAKAKDAWSPGAR